MKRFPGAVALGCLAAIAAAGTTKIERALMSINDTLAEVRDNLVEASEEIVAKLDELAAGGADAVLVEQIKTLSRGLADIVPNAQTPAPEPEPEV